MHRKHEHDSEKTEKYIVRGQSRLKDQPSFVYTLRRIQVIIIPVSQKVMECSMSTIYCTGLPVSIETSVAGAPIAGERVFTRGVLMTRRSQAGIGGVCKYEEVCRRYAW